MTRHEMIPYQTEPPSSRPPDNLALVDAGISFTHSFGHICRGKCSAKGLFIVPLASDLASLPQVHARPSTGQIQKNHSDQTLAPGFGLPGLSGAYRQPKLFRFADRPV